MTAPEHRLPPGVPSGGPDVGGDPEAAVARGLALMHEAEARIVDAVERLGAAWVVRAVTNILDAWGRLEAGDRAETLARAHTAGEQAARRVEGELRELFALAPERQQATPLQLVRSLRREATDVLRAAGIPGVERDDFEVRTLPDDEYGLVLRSLDELGEDDLQAIHLAWGVGKATVVRARAQGAARR